MHSMAVDSSSPPGPPPLKRRLDDGPWWLYPALLVAAVALTALIARRTHHVEPPASATADAVGWTPTDRPQGETVSLEIDFGNGARRVFENLPWKESMTVADLLKAATSFHPAIRYKTRGTGEMAFVESLEGVANGGAGGRNWLFSVNGQHAEVGIGAQPLQAGDAVLWRFDFPK